ncbi:MAG: ABC transporter substrate-binding protein [Anaerolineales bacterium]
MPDNFRFLSRSLTAVAQIAIYLLVLATLLTACGTLTEPPGAPANVPESTMQSIALIDGRGREVVLSAPAQRVVSLAPSNTEILFAIGAGNQVVGRDEFSDYPPDALNVSSVGNTFGKLNEEAIVALEPDLVLVSDLNSPEQVASLEEIGLTSFVLPNPTDFEGLYRNLETVGMLTGRRDQTRDLADQLRARVDRVVQRIQGTNPVTVYYEVDSSDPNAPWTTGADTFHDVLIQLAGGTNVASDITGWGQISLEELIARDPEVMIFGEGPFVPTTPDLVAARPGWGSITAVANNAVYAVDTNLVDRPGPRLVDALERIAALLHPEAFN